MRATPAIRPLFALSLLLATSMAACNLSAAPAQTVADAYTDTPAASPTGTPTASPTASPSAPPAPLEDFRILFVVFLKDASSEIFMMKSDGSGATNLTSDSAKDNYPTCSPDGRRIVFQSNRDGNDEIYVMNADGSNPVNITNNPDNDWAQDWCVQ